MNKLAFILFGLALNYSCSRNLNDYEKINHFLVNKLDYNDLRSQDFLIVINEMGTCMNCNNSFSKYMSKYIDSEKVLFLICSSGSRIDISMYLNSEENLILYDMHNDFSELNLINQSGIFKLKDEKIDTLIKINVKNVIQNLEDL